MSSESIDEQSRTRPTIPLLVWPEVKRIIESGNLALLGRSEDQQRVYDAFRENLRKEWNSISDFILADKFGIRTVVDTSTGKYAAVREDISGNAVVLRPNDFPYHFESGIHHYVLWKIGNGLTQEEIKEHMDSLLNSTTGIKDIVMYVNPPSLKSIPDVDHAHILYVV